MRLRSACRVWCGSIVPPPQSLAPGPALKFANNRTAPVAAVCKQRDVRRALQPGTSGLAARIADVMNPPPGTPSSSGVADSLGKHVLASTSPQAASSSTCSTRFLSMHCETPAIQSCPMRGSLELATSAAETVETRRAAPLLDLSRLRAWLSRLCASLLAGVWHAWGFFGPCYQSSWTAGGRTACSRCLAIDFA